MDHEWTDSRPGGETWLVRRVRTHGLEVTELYARIRFRSSLRSVEVHAPGLVDPAGMTDAQLQQLLDSAIAAEAPPPDSLPAVE